MPIEFTSAWIGTFTVSQNIDPNFHHPQAAFVQQRELSSPWSWACFLQRKWLTDEKPVGYLSQAFCVPTCTGQSNPIEFLLAYINTWNETTQVGYWYQLGQYKTPCGPTDHIQSMPIEHLLTRVDQNPCIHVYSQVFLVLVWYNIFGYESVQSFLDWNSPSV